MAKVTLAAPTTTMTMSQATLCVLLNEAEEEVMGGPSEDFVGVTPVNSSCTGTAMGHVTPYGGTGVWSVGKLVPMIFGLVNRGKICGHSMCSVPADLLFHPPSPSPPGLCGPSGDFA